MLLMVGIPHDLIGLSSIVHCVFFHCLSVQVATDCEIDLHQIDSYSQPVLLLVDT